HDEAIPVPEGISYRSPAVPGLARDIEAVAGIVGRLAFQTLLEAKAVRNTYYPSLGDHLLWSNRPGWIFDRSFQLIEQNYKRVENCPSCNPQQFDAPLQDEVQQLQKAVRQNAIKSSPWKIAR